MAEYRNVKEYFQLFGPRPIMGSSGTGAENKQQVVLFIGVFLGCLLKVIYDDLTGTVQFNWKLLIIGSIVSVVVFPQLYYTGGLGKRRLTFAHWALAFQNGFFWTTAFDEIIK